MLSLPLPPLSQAEIQQANSRIHKHEGEEVTPPGTSDHLWSSDAESSSTISTIQSPVAHEAECLHDADEEEESDASSSVPEGERDDDDSEDEEEEEEEERCYVAATNLVDAQHSGHGYARNEVNLNSSLDAEKNIGPVHVKLQISCEEEGKGGCCRVCYQGVEVSATSGEPMKLGCACKDDLAFAHRQCAEAWFKIKGDRTCEICGSTAHNIIGTEDNNFMDHWNDLEANNQVLSRPESCWHNQPLCNSLLLCLIIFLILTWLFRVTLF